MLTQQDQEFIRYWEQERKQKKKYLKKLSIGLPLGALIVGALMTLLLSGWHKKAEMVLQGYSSLLVVIIIAALEIVVFMVIFSARHQWEQREQFYQELLRKRDGGATV